jgi:hypothetical protein
MFREWQEALLSAEIDLTGMPGPVSTSFLQDMSYLITEHRGTAELALAQLTIPMLVEILRQEIRRAIRLDIFRWVDLDTQ